MRYGTVVAWRRVTRSDKRLEQCQEPGAIRSPHATPLEMRGPCNMGHARHQPLQANRNAARTRARFRRVCPAKPQPYAVALICFQRSAGWGTAQRTRMDQHDPATPLRGPVPAANGSVESGSDLSEPTGMMGRRLARAVVTTGCNLPQTEASGTQ